MPCHPLITSFLRDLSTSLRLEISLLDLFFLSFSSQNWPDSEWMNNFYRKGNFLKILQPRPAAAALTLMVVMIWENFSYATESKRKNCSSSFLFQWVVSKRMMASVWFFFHGGRRLVGREGMKWHWPQGLAPKTDFLYVYHTLA